MLADAMEARLPYDMSRRPCEANTDSTDDTDKDVCARAVNKSVISEKSVFEKKKFVSRRVQFPVHSRPFFTPETRQIQGTYREGIEMIKSWSHQLLINYILTIYVLYTKIGVLSSFENSCFLSHKILIYNRVAAHSRRHSVNNRCCVVQTRCNVILR